VILREGQEKLYHDAQASMHTLDCCGLIKMDT